jgi:hypothetical protein
MDTECVWTDIAQGTSLMDQLEARKHAMKSKQR